MIELDGTFGEGGGQILRTSLALSLLTGKPFHMRNIRARRDKPGLRPQHLMCVNAAAAIGQAQTRGASVGSSDLTFEPGAIVPGQYHFAIGTAGATALVLQTLYLPLALGTDGPSEVMISGGTHNTHAPCYHFLETTWRAYLEAMDLRIKLHMVRPGFYPRGGGVIRANIQPCASVQPLKLKEATPLAKITGFSAVAGLPEDIAERQANRALKRFRSARRDLKVKIDEQRWDGGPGTILALTLDTHPAPTMFFALGERGKKAERVADEAVDETLAFLNSDTPVVDPHSADQIILPLALAPGASEYAVSEVTMHLITNVAIIQRFVDRTITIEGEEGRAGTVKVAHGNELRSP